MRGFVFDYGGTLDTLENPVAYLESVRRRYPEHKIILYTGSLKDELNRRHPGLEQLADHWICKPDYLKDAFANLGLTFKELTYFDDEAHMREAVNRSFRGVCKTGIPRDLEKLLQVQ